MRKISFILLSNLLFMVIMTSCAADSMVGKYTLYKAKVNGTIIDKDHSEWNNYKDFYVELFFDRKVTVEAPYGLADGTYSMTGVVLNIFDKNGNEFGSWLAVPIEFSFKISGGVIIMEQKWGGDVSVFEFRR